MWAVGPESCIALAALVQQPQDISIVTYGSRGNNCDPDVTTLCSVQSNCTERRSRSSKADCSWLHHVVALKFSQAGLWPVFSDSCFLSCFCLFCLPVILRLFLSSVLSPACCCLFSLPMMPCTSLSNLNHSLGSGSLISAHLAPPFCRSVKYTLVTSWNHLEPSLTNYWQCCFGQTPFEKPFVCC